MQKHPMTVEGFKKAQAELHTLKTVERPAVIRAIASARDLGDLSENAEYHAARERQGFLEARLAELETMVSTAEVIDVSTLSGTKVRFGATVTLEDEETGNEKKYKIVGEDEADITKGMISNVSPVSRALMGKNVGDSVEVNTPSGRRSYEIIDVKFV